MLLKAFNEYVIILLSSEVKLQGGLKNNTIHSYMPVSSRFLQKNDNRQITVSVETCLISPLCQMELWKNSNKYTLGFTETFHYVINRTTFTHKYLSSYQFLF